MMCVKLFSVLVAAFTLGSSAVMWAHNGAHEEEYAIRERAAFMPESKDVRNGEARKNVAGDLQGLPPGFTAEVLPIDAFSATDQKPFITGFTFSPQGTMFVLLQGGMVLVYQDGAQQGTPFIDLTAEVNHDLDRGLLGIALQPDFNPDTGNNWVYLLYVVSSTVGADPIYENAPGNYGFGRLTRYRAVRASGALVADPASRQVLLGKVNPDGTVIEGAIANLTNTHSVGAMCFGEDGSLLISAGDGASYIFADEGGNDSCAFQCGQSIGPYKNTPWEDVGAYRAQHVRSLAGKILRVNPETGEGYASNPFAALAGFDLRRNESRVWALGLRNPFRFSIKPGTGSSNPLAGKPGVLFIGDVGWYDWEEVNVSQRGGENFGWPIIEGNYRNLPYPEELPAGMVRHGVDTRPLFTWPRNHSRDSEPVGFVEEKSTTGTSVTGGVHYRGGSYPPEYVGAYFFGDYTGSWIRTLETTDTGGTVTLASVGPVFGQSGEHLSGAVDFDTDPVTGDVYFSALGQVYHIRYGSPIAIIETDRFFGAEVPLTVTFSGLRSQGKTLTYLWNFGDGSPFSSAAEPVHSFALPGVYDVVLRVTAEGGASSIATQRIHVGNTPPSARIVSPPAHHWYFDQGSTLTLFGSGTDEQDNAQQLQYRWVVDLGHNTHIHPGGAFNESGTDRTQFLADLSGHGLSTDTFFYKINFQVTDRGGLTTTAQAMAYGIEELPASCGEAIVLPADGRLHTLGGSLGGAVNDIWVSAQLEPGEYAISGLKSGGDVVLYTGNCGNLNVNYDTSVRPSFNNFAYNFRFFTTLGETVFLKFSGFESNSLLGVQFLRLSATRAGAMDWNLLE